jgi:hypothetical protein
MEQQYAAQKQKLLPRQTNPPECSHVPTEDLFPPFLLQKWAWWIAYGWHAVREHEYLLAVPAPAVEALAEHGGDQTIVAEQAQLHMQERVLSVGILQVIREYFLAIKQNKCDEFNVTFNAMHKVW